MAVAAHAGHRASPLDEVRERYRAVEEAEPGHDRGRYVEALKAFLATAERHAESIAPQGQDIALLLDDAAMAFYRASDPELAERAVDLGLRLSPGTSSLLHHKALVLLALNRDLPTVVRLVDQALEANPSDRGLWATRGDALRLLGRADDAAEAYLRAQELDPSSAEYIDRALKLVPHHPKALRLKVELARAHGGDLPALAAAEELLARNPGDPELLLSRAELLASVGRRDEALAVAHGLAGDGASPARLLEARLLFDLGRADESVPIARGIVGAASPPVAALEEIARRSAAGRPDLALAARRKIGQVDPRNVQNLLDLKLLATTVGETDVALAACRAVLAASPESLEALRGIAELEATADRLPEALEAYRALARTHPDAVGELRKGLELARSLGKADALREFAEAILSVEPSDADARAELGRALAAAGDAAGALREYDALLAAHPGEIPVLLAKRELLETGRDRLALANVLDELFRLDPTRTDVAVERGNVYLTAAYDLAEGSPERQEAARTALVAYERASTDPEASDVSLLGIARASRLVDEHERALAAYGEFLGKEANRGRLAVRKELAHALRETGRYAEAVEEYGKALAGGLEDPDLLWGAAEAYGRLGQDAPALRLLDILLRREPTNPVFLRRKGQLVLKAGRREEALRVLQQAVRGAESDPQAYFEVAEALRAQGAYADAVGYFRQGLELDPRHRYGRLALAETLLLAGQYAEVVGLVDPLLKEDPNDLAAWKARADAWRALGRSAEVLYSLEAILLLEPESGPGLLEMYRLRRDRGERKEAYEALDRLLGSSAPEAKDPTLHLERGDLAAAVGLPEAANASYERAAGLDPAIRGEIAIRRARLRLAAGRPDLALEVLDDGLKAPDSSGPPSLAALLLRAELLGALERPAEARAAYEEVRRREPKSPTAANGIARAMLAEGRPADAVAFLEAALPQLPPEEASYLLLAEAEGGLGHLDRARDVLAKGLEALPRSVGLWSRLGEVGIARQGWPEAANAFAHALALAPASLELLLRAGFVAERMNHPNEALALYDRATAAEPKSLPAWTSRGLALLATGRPADAAASFDRALSLDSDFAPAKDGKRLAGQKTRDAEIQRYGREALLLEARLSRPVTRNDLFVTLHVPYEFLGPVLTEIAQVPKVDLSHLEPAEAQELDQASYRLIAAALERRPPGIERRGFTLADIAVLSPTTASLEQLQRLFGYLRAVLEADLRPEHLALPPDVEELARQALALPPESRTLFQLVRSLRVGVYKARLIKAVEQSGAAARGPLPSLDLGAYSPEFRPPASEAADAGEAFFAPETRPAPAPTVPSVPSVPTGTPPAAPVPHPTALPAATPAAGPRATPASHPVPVSARPGDRCVGCGGLASAVHACGVPLCPTCLAQFPKCPKCGERIGPDSTRPIPSAPPGAPSTARASPASPPPNSGGLKSVFRRSPRPAPEPPAVPSPLAKAAAARRGSPHRPDHDPTAKEKPASPEPAATPTKKGEAPEPARHSAVPEGHGKAAPSAPATAAPPPAAETPAAPAKPKPAKVDDEPRL